MKVICVESYLKLSNDESYQVMKVKEVEIAKEVIRSDAGDVSPVAMFYFGFGTIVTRCKAKMIAISSILFVSINFFVLGSIHCYHANAP